MLVPVSLTRPCRLRLPVPVIGPEIVTFAEEVLKGVEFDLLFVSCTNYRGVEARPLLVERFGRPVVTSNQATIDATVCQG